MEKPMFDKILNWKLLKGSHKFPGPAGGTCINEAAIVAAGFAYREVTGPSDCPPCFSRTVAAFAIELNDMMSDVRRQKLLMPFVTRLAGTKDTRKVEVARAKHIVFRTVRDVMPIILRRRGGLFRYALRCASSKNFNSAAFHIMDVRYNLDAFASPWTELPMRRAFTAVDNLVGRYKRCAGAIKTISEVIELAAEDEKTRRQVYEIAVSTLDEAILLGNHPEPIETAAIVARMDTAKEQWTRAGKLARAIARETAMAGGE